jgi:hypothetical protein
MGIYRADETENVEVSTTVAGEERRVKFGKAPVNVNDEGLDPIMSTLADDERNPVRHGGKPRSGGRVRQVGSESEE